MMHGKSNIKKIYVLFVAEFAALHRKGERVCLVLPFIVLAQ
jgi:hypothetical protein